MKKRYLVIGIVLLFIFMSFASSSAFDNVKKSIMPVSNGNTLYVGGSGPDNYTRIQDAINDADSGDTVFVYDDSSPYYENLFLYKTISLIGEDKNTTIIDGNKYSNVIFVNADMVTISGFTLVNSSVDVATIRPEQYAGVDIFANYTTVTNNIIKDNYIGVAIWKNWRSILYDFNGNNISNNMIISNVYTGIILWSCTNSIVINNIILYNDRKGIHVDDCYYNLISGNKISNNKNGIFISGNEVIGDITNNEISNNNITKNRHYGILIMNSGTNKILKNNFIGNRISNARFSYYFWNLELKNIWDGNYWRRPRTKPHLIRGKISILWPIGLIPWFEIDWHPAKEPYDI